MTRAEVRAANLAKRNAHIKDAFAERYTKQPRPRKVTREYVVAQLAGEFFLSAETVENILYKQVA
jgi:hypothetical protein